MKRGVSRARRAFTFCVAVSAALCALSAAAPRRATACPVRSTFGQNIRMANLIVVGRVAAFESSAVTIEGEESTLLIADLEVEDVLAGEVDSTRRVKLAGYHIEQERESESKTLLVLASARESFGASYTFLAFDVTDLAVRSALTSRVREMLEIMRIADETEGWRRHVEWAVRCVESPYLREEAVYELERYGTRYTEEGEEEEMIDASQKERLVRVLLEAGGPDEPGAVELASLLSDSDDLRVAGQLESWLERASVAPPEEATRLMYIISSQLGWRTGAWLASQYSDDAKLAVKRVAIRRFLDLLHAGQELPEALTAAVAEEAEEDSEAAAERREAVEEAESEFEFEPEEPPEPLEPANPDVEINEQDLPNQ